MTVSHRSKFNEIESPEKFLPLAKRAVEIARRLGADFADVSISLGREIGISVDKSSIKTADTGWGKGISIRAFINGGMGYVSIDGIDESRISSLVEKTVELAKIATPDPDFVALPNPEKAENEPSVFDEKILSIGPSDVIEWASKNIQGAQAVSPDVIVSGDISMNASASVLVSSTGIALARKSTSLGIGFFCIIRRDGTVGSFFDHDSARFLDDFQPEGLAEKITKRAQAYMNAKKIDTQRTTLVLGPISGFGLLASLASAANAESIQRKRSLLADKLNTQIAPDFISITDNGLIERGLSSSAYDGEGAKRKIVPVIEKGKFSAQLHNSYTANKVKVPNTGHGSRTRGISPSNLNIALGEKSADQLIREVKDGIYLECGGLDPDLISGDISTNLDFAIKIENGELTYPISNTMVSGNLMELLKNIDAVSSDGRVEPGIVMPTVRIQDIQVSSGSE
jgi:PmbA protein